jgi:macrolide transport system ATP-binding/permease protein
MMKAFRNRLAYFITPTTDHRTAIEADFNAELESHIQMHTDDNMKAGMSPDEARREAILKLGGIEPTKEAHRDRRTLPVLDNLAQDLRFSLRQMRTNPGFSIVAILILAIGICSSTAIFAFVDAAILKPLPYQNPDRLVAAFESTKVCPQCNLSYLDYIDWKRMNTVFSSFDAYTGRQFLLRGDAGDVEPINGARVSSGFFRTLGVTPIAGRDFHDNEESPASGPLTVLLSYEAWQTRFGGKDSVIGQTLILSGQPNTIIGVLPRGFHYAPVGTPEFWEIMRPTPGCEDRRSCHNLYAVGRLKDGTSFAAASSNITAIADQLQKEYPPSNRGQAGLIMPLAEIVAGRVRPILLALFAGACLLMVIVWTNVASLLLVRSEGRKRELAVRRALGASGARLVSQFVVEGIALVTCGAVLGLIGAKWTIQLLAALIPKFMMDSLPFLRGIDLNSHALLFATGVSLIAAIFFTLTPAIHLVLSRTRDGLAEGSRGSAGLAWQRIGSKLVVAELATAVVLLVGAGLLGKSLYLMLNVDLGFKAEGLATILASAPSKTYQENDRRIQLAREVRTRIAALPGVTSVGLSGQLPVTHQGNTSWIVIVGAPPSPEHNDVPERAVSAGYFETIGAKLAAGRYFNDSEDLSKPLVVIVNQVFAQQYFPGQNPIGKRIAYERLNAAASQSMEIVGVVENLQEGQLDQKPRAFMYVPFNQSPGTFLSLTVRTASAEKSIIGAVQRELREIDRDIAIVTGTTMVERIHNSPSAYLKRSSAWLVGAFAAVALILCIVGLYGVVAYSVSQRTREIGVRIALGAARGSVYRMILTEAGWLTLAGTIIGLCCAVALARFLEGLLFGVTQWDALTLASVTAILGIASLVASYIPAHRAASVNPIEALRSE